MKKGTHREIAELEFEIKVRDIYFNRFLYKSRILSISNKIDLFFDIKNHFTHDFC